MIQQKSIQTVLHWISKNKILIIVIFVFVSRLPQIFSPTLLMDGDECIVGLMAKHSLEGKGTPIFFYGQSYGFSWVEVVFIRLYYSVLGVSDISVKIAMLSLWTIGLVFFYKSIHQIVPKSKSWLTFAFMLLFIFSPTWAIWSMKARGGYLTAFTLSSLATYLAVKKWRNPYWVYFILGMLLVLIKESQVLWLAGLLPIIAYSFFRQNPVKAIIFTLLGVAISWVSFYIISINTLQFWKAPTLSFSEIDLNSFTGIPLKVYQNLTGGYNQTGMLEMNNLTKIWGMLFACGILLALIVILVLLLKRIRVSPWVFVFCVSVCFTLGYLVVLNRNEPRYLLPLFGYAQLMLAALVAEFKINRVLKSVYFVILFIGAYSFISNIKYYPSKKQELTQLLNELEQKEIGYVFCDKGLLQWQIMFYSHESVVARYKSKTDRYPTYVEKVNGAYKEGIEKTALVGLRQNWYEKEEGITSINDWFFIYENPSEKMLEKFGFTMD